jgi:hypothetical protein
VRAELFVNCPKIVLPGSIDVVVNMGAVGPKNGYSSSNQGFHGIVLPTSWSQGGNYLGSEFFLDHKNISLEYVTSIIVFKADERKGLSRQSLAAMKEGGDNRVVAMSLREFL